MFGNILGGIAKIFGGSAHEKALKEVQPVVDAINEYYNSYSNLSNDELRGKTVEFKSRIAEYLKEVDDQIKNVHEQISNLGNGAIDEKEQLFKEIAELEKNRDSKLEEILKELLPEAFATIKETARRFTENEIISFFSKLGSIDEIRKRSIPSTLSNSETNSKKVCSCVLFPNSPFP